jgi:hypothetical protein
VVPAGKPAEFARELTDKDTPLQKGYVKEIQVELTAGRPYILQADSEKFEPVLFLVPPGGKQAVTRGVSMAGQKTRGSRIDFTPDATGTYILAVTNRDPTQTGPFMLRVQAFEKKAD